MSAAWVVTGRGDRCRWVPADHVPEQRHRVRVGRCERRPFDLAALERALGSTTTRETAARLQIAEPTVRRLAASGLTAFQADDFAIKAAGRHPVGVWEDWYRRD